jgi:hypothetical protein
MHICNSVQSEGKFFFWRWELWSIGGGAGVEWFFREKNIYIGENNLLWIVFYWQRWWRGE